MPIVCCVVPASAKIPKSNISKDDIAKIKQMLKEKELENHSDTDKEKP